MPQSHQIAVIGAGVFGAWIAWHLAAAGKRVLLVDQYGPASTRASSGGESRVIRMAYGADAIYTHMAQRSLVKWISLFRHSGRPELFAPTGVLWMARSGNGAAEQSVLALAAAGIEHQILDAAALRMRYPQIEVPDDGWAIFEPLSGGLLARRAVQAVVEDACRRGATLARARVMPFAEHADPAVAITEDGQRIEADLFIYACGPWLGKLFPNLLGSRIFPTRQEVFYVGCPAGDERFAPAHMPTWMDFDREWYGLPDLESRGFKLACDRHGETIDPDSAERTPSPAGIAAAREFLRRRFPALGDAPIVGSEVCQYENSANGDLLIDRHPRHENVWLVGGGSGHGFKHGPAVGEYLVQRLGNEVPEEARFSLSSKATRQQREVH